MNEKARFARYENRHFMKYSRFSVDANNSLIMYEAYKCKTFMKSIALQPLVADHAHMPHMKAIYVPFNWLYGSLICNQRLQSDKLK